MRSIEKSRSYEVLVDGAWLPVHWEQLDKGDTVRAIPMANVIDPYINDINPFVVAELPHLRVDPVGTVIDSKQMHFSSLSHLSIEQLLEELKIRGVPAPPIYP